MEKKSSVETIKDWLFPGMITLLSFFLWNTITDIKSDISEMKADIRTLMVQSTADHIKIEGLERTLYNKSTTKIPVKEEEPAMINRWAVLPNNKSLEYEL